MVLITPRAFFPILLLLGPALQASVLHADGIIRVKGDSWRGTRVTVVPEFSQPYDVDLRAPRFVLHLPLQSTYLVRAEHVDCPTKEVVFDLRIPSELASQEYEFPFEIILEIQPEGVELRYAGPVGLVSFDEAAKDFNYITDHRLIAVLPKADELRERAPAELLPQLRPLNVSSTNGVPEDRHVVAPAPSAEREPSHSTPMVDPKITAAEVSIPPTPIEEAPAMTSATVTSLAVEHPEVPSITTTEITAPIHVAMASAPIVVTERVVQATSDIQASRREKLSGEQEAPAQVMPEETPRPCGTEETVVSGRMVIHVERIQTEDGGCEELRTVTHAYGAVFHFHNGRPVTEAYFNIVSKAH